MHPRKDQGSGAVVQGLQPSRDSGLSGVPIGQDDSVAENASEERRFVEGDVCLDWCAKGVGGGESKCWEEDFLEGGPECAC